MRFARPSRRSGVGRLAARVALAVASAVGGAHAAPVEPVRRLDLYVQPYYEAAASPGGAPSVAVNKAYDALLASTRREDIVRARDAIARDNAMVTPMTLMVLAIRLYDVGLRDDAVFWFYAAKNRYFTLAGVADVKAPSLAQVEDATRNFAVLAGPGINGYAFCDVANQQAIAAKAMQWTLDNPYRAIFLPQVPARPGDRAANLAEAQAKLRDNVAKEREYLAQPANRAKLATERKANGTDERYCWR
jgi:hypothetical protein